MAISVKEEVIPGADTLPVPMAGMSQDAMDALLRKMTAEAVDRAFTYADAVSRDQMAQFKEMLSGYAKPKAQILAVEVSGERRKLSKEAPEYLGRMIINAKRGIATILIGPAGCGKTIAAELLAESLGLPFGQVCLTAGASETWLFGRQTPNGFVEATFSRMYREGGVFLLDELDAADANMILAINTALANGTLYNPISGQEHKRSEKFVCVATANTACLGGDVIYTGRSRLDGASLTRFVKIPVTYSLKIEEQVCPDGPLREAMWNARLKLSELKAPQIISTRCMEYAYAQLAEGVNRAEIFESLTLGWPEELIDQTGLKVGKGKKKNA